jgi:hypothetical protein
MNHWEPSVGFAYPADDAPEIDAAVIYQRAVEFAVGLINRSRTEQAARVRLACARYVITARHEGSIPFTRSTCL